MKAIISSTYSDQYLFFLPIVTYCWNKLGVDVICFMPKPKLTTTVMDMVLDSTNPRYVLAHKTCIDNDLRVSLYRFSCPEHKEATYAQCARLYAAALDLPEDEILITSDVDMGLFKVPISMTDDAITIFGHDLVPPYQFPMCYASGKVRDWRRLFELNGRTYQQCLDDLLGHIEADHFRGNYWGKDQETLFNQTKDDVYIANRARPGTQFASNRVDRDDINWRHYVDDYLVDAHLWRPGFEENNFNNIMELLRMKYPCDNFDWLIEYRNGYIKLL